MIPKKRRAYLLGLRAETLAVLYLASGGEIDVIAMRGNVVAFVEVKARANLDAAALSITPDKARRMSRAARVWVSRNPWSMTRTLRGDAILMAPGKWPRRVVGAVEIVVS
jgi:putative endonuclease